jgi:hypothetical protein
MAFREEEVQFALLMTSMRRERKGESERERERELMSEVIKATDKVACPPSISPHHKQQNSNLEKLTLKISQIPNLEN